MLSAIDKNTPGGWSSAALRMVKENKDYELVDIPKYSSLYITLEDITYHARNRETKRIVEVQNPFLYAQFLLKKAEYESRGSCKVAELFHDTGASKITSIVSGNLDRRLVFRAKYGQGVSFSPYPWYANKESSRSNGTDRAMIVANVLVGNKEYVCGCKQLPSEGNDTTVGNGDKVYVKYYDHEFYPKYVVYYTHD